MLGWHRLRKMLISQTGSPASGQLPEAAAPLPEALVRTERVRRGSRARRESSCAQTLYVTIAFIKPRLIKGGIMLSPMPIIN